MIVLSWAIESTQAWGLGTQDIGFGWRGGAGLSAELSAKPVLKTSRIGIFFSSPWETHQPTVRNR